MSELRIIKKYPNRRLYDTEISKYVTLTDVRDLVFRQTPFQVRDARSDEDITRSILLQIIMEQEEGGTPIFSEQVLEKIIRFYGGSLQGAVTSYLERSLSLFVDQQAGFQRQMQAMISSDPISAMREITERNLFAWQEMQSNLMRAATAPLERSLHSDRADPDPSSSSVPDPISERDDSSSTPDADKSP
ncbi:MAG: polyhydroxyalkanoate synthesis repressor PhaR [Ectothiorhodospiraceae bacterium AqS1]|nr:polyhydroxyalkanoate synthesis repressor PhaR [Ectothiorhodospiraceae bacterium AqS1]